MTRVVWLLLIGLHLVNADVYNYGGGSVAVNGGGLPVVGASWSPWSDLSQFTYTANPGGTSWTYNPSGWSPGSWGTNIPSWTTFPQSWNTNPQSWTTFPQSWTTFPSNTWSTFPPSWNTFPSTWSTVPQSWSTTPPNVWNTWSVPNWGTTPPQTWTTWLGTTPQSGQGTGAGLASFTKVTGNCPGNYLGAVTQLTLDACAGACLSTTACAGFSFNLQSTYPQCILKNAVCASPDPSGVFTFFARNGYQPSYSGAQPAYVGAQPAYYPPYIPPYAPYMPPAVAIAQPVAVAPVAPVAIPAYPPPYYGGGYGYAPYRGYPFWKSASARQFKRPVGAQYFEMPANCSGPIVRGPYLVELETCAADCSASKYCTGFSFDNSSNSCVLHTGVCQTMASSQQWTYFARGGQPNAEMPALTGDDKQQQEQLLDNAASVSLSPEANAIAAASTQGRPSINSYSSYNIINPLELIHRYFEKLSGNCQGNNLDNGNFTASLDECAQRCLQAYDCAGFSFNMMATGPGEFECMLKASSCSDPIDGSPFHFFRRRSLNVFNPRFRRQRDRK